MIITAANHQFKFHIQQFIIHCNQLNYEYEIYDLGKLNIGRYFPVKNKLFQEQGYYNHVNNRWKTKALHKPGIIKNALSFTNLTYMDSDAFPIARFDEVFDHDFDLGVTIRPEEGSILGKINAGVIFVKPSAINLIDEWIELTEILGNDQLALNKIYQSKKYNIKEFPTSIYNYYYFPDVPNKDVKIVHFKTSNKRAFMLNYSKIFI